MTWRWVFTSFWFYITVIVTLVVMNTAAPAAVDATLSTIYPQVKTKKLFGLIVKKSDDPRIAWQRKLILGVCWTGALGLNAYVLLLCLPATVRKAKVKARQSESRADALVSVKPSESIIFYNKALKLAVDHTHESILQSKIDALDNVIKSGRSSDDSHMPPGTSDRKGTGTIALARDEASGQSQKREAIGNDNRYRIERTLGQGAMGVVFHAKDQLLLRDVALKKLTSGLNQNPDVVTRFQQEARALAQLSHPNIVQVYDFVKQDNQYWIAMEYVEGNDLGSLIEERGKYPLGEALQICIQIAEAMAYAHGRGVVHRDFKPSNVLVTTEGAPKVMDFGLAKLSHSSIATMEGSLLGSPAFMSPEQARGETADARSDIYAMGGALYQLSTGKLPFEGDVKRIIAQKIAGHQPTIDPLHDQIPADLAQLIEEMMATDPGDRPATMKAVGIALSRIDKAYTQSQH